MFLKISDAIVLSVLALSGKGAAGAERGGDLTSHLRLIHILSFVLFKSRRNVTLLVQWAKMRWVRGEALHVLNRPGTSKRAEAAWEQENESLKGSPGSGLLMDPPNISGHTHPGPA